MSSILSDKAEPSEALSVTTVWSYGFKDARYLTSSNQLSHFRCGAAISEEQEVLGRRGAYFVHQVFKLAAGAERSWGIVADVNQGPAVVLTQSERTVYCFVIRPRRLSAVNKGSWRTSLV